MSQTNILRKKMLELGDQVQILCNENDKDTNIMSPYKRRMHKNLVKKNKVTIENLSTEINVIKKQLASMETSNNVPQINRPVRIDYSSWTRRPRMGLYIA